MVHVEVNVEIVYAYAFPALSESSGDNCIPLPSRSYPDVRRVAAYVRRAVVTTARSDMDYQTCRQYAFEIPKSSLHSWFQRVVFTGQSRIPPRCQ